MASTKRAQVSASVLTYTLGLVIVAGVLIFGYRAVSSVSSGIDTAALVQLKTELSNDVFEMGQESYGSFAKHTYSLAGFDELCVADLNQREVALGAHTLDSYPLVRDSLESGVDANAFLIGTKSGFESFSIGNISLQHYPNFVCVSPQAGRPVELGLEARGHSTLVLTEFVSSAALDPAREVELSSQDGRVALIVPQGTTATAEEITIEMRAPPANDAPGRGSDIYEFKPHGTTFSTPVEVQLAYDTGVVSDCPEQLVFYLFDEQGNPESPQRSKEIDCERHVATFEISTFSYGFVGPPPRPGDLAGLQVVPRQGFCVEHPEHESCGDLCLRQPDHVFCKPAPETTVAGTVQIVPKQGFCVEYPDQPDCAGLCTREPDNVLCQPAPAGTYAATFDVVARPGFCVENPDNPACGICQQDPTNTLCIPAEFAGLGVIPVQGWCLDHPTHESCGDLCTREPNDVKCRPAPETTVAGLQVVPVQGFCAENPTHPSCSELCAREPENPSCTPRADPITIAAIPQGATLTAGADNNVPLAHIGTIDVIGDGFFFSTDNGRSHAFHTYDEALAAQHLYQAGIAFPDDARGTQYGYVTVGSGVNTLDYRSDMHTSFATLAANTGDWVFKLGDDYGDQYICANPAGCWVVAAETGEMARFNPDERIGYVNSRTLADDFIELTPEEKKLADQGYGWIRNQDGIPGTDDDKWQLVPPVPHEETTSTEPPSRDEWTDEERRLASQGYGWTRESENDEWTLVPPKDDEETDDQPWWCVMDWMCG